MGRKLLQNCSIFRSSLEACDRALQRLPDGPSWSLISQLDVTRNSACEFEADVCQPLCTAIQIGLINVIRACGISFGAVIGHSSGEISAAYATSVLTVEDAIGIAYYRGYVAHMARGIHGQNGKMMAVAMSYDQAQTYCAQSRFFGRLGVAAHNGPTNVTLSGDSDAILDALEDLKARNIFTRLLNVEVAYHSNHMNRCAAAYLQCLKQLHIQPRLTQNQVVWFSSVEGYTQPLQSSMSDLSAKYWVDNMVEPVLFSRAVQSTLEHDRTFGCALEVGPHPALRSSFRDITSEMKTPSMRYIGCLYRDVDDAESMSKMLAQLWEYMGPSNVSLDAWGHALGLERHQRMVKGLPPYVWDHPRSYWLESRISRHSRIAMSSRHELLGHLHEDVQNQLTWRNVVCQNDIPWVKGHKFQGQVILPGAAYISMAVEAAHMILKNTTLRMAEVRDFKIVKPIVFPEDGEKIEMLFKVTINGDHHTGSGSGVLETTFACYMSSNAADLERTCEGKLLAHIGSSAETDFPTTTFDHHDLPPLESDQFFNVLQNIGISYDGLFRSLTSIERIWGVSNASASWGPQELGDMYTLHPAVLDAAFQNAFATFFTRADGALNAYLPIGSRRIVINPSQQYHSSSGDIRIHTQASIVKSDIDEFEVDIDIYGESANPFGVQVDGLLLKSVGETFHSSDRSLFAKRIYNVDVALGSLSPMSAQPFENESEYIDAVERTTLFFLSRLNGELWEKDGVDIKPHHVSLLKGVDMLLNSVRKGEHAVVRKEWLNDTPQTISALHERFPDSIDLALLTAVGENISSVVRGESEMLEHMLKDDLLTRLYSEGRGFAACNDQIAQWMKQIAHKYPRMRILEIGAGTGGTTAAVLDAIGNAYSSYTYTDISVGFFGKAAARFASHASRMVFKTFNIEFDPLSQGFEDTSYDIVIAANVLHATSQLKPTLQRVRRLLRPGGFLLAVEVTGNMLRETGLMGGLEGWWLGADDGRFPTPGLSPRDWDQTLIATRFSGIASIFYDCSEVAKHNCSAFYTQAVDDRIEALNDPLACGAVDRSTRFLIIGGESLPVNKIVQRAKRILNRITDQVATCVSLEKLQPGDIPYETNVLCFTELDRPLFLPLVLPKALKGLQGLLEKAAHVVWVTSGRLTTNPYQNMMVGVGRAANFELPHLRTHFLDLDQTSLCNADTAVKHLLQMILLSSSADAHNILWAQEPEVFIEGDTPIIPRIVPDSVANETINHHFNDITVTANPGDSIVVRRTNEKAALMLGTTEFTKKDDSALVVEFSTALHSHSETPRYLCFLQRSGNNHGALALADTEASTISLCRDTIFDLNSPQFEVETLVGVGSCLIASHVLDNSPKDGAIVVYKPSIMLAEALIMMAKSTGREIVFITDTVEEYSSHWIHIHPFMRVRSIRNLIPKETTVLWYFSDISLDNILPALPATSSTRRFDPKDLSANRDFIAKAYDMMAFFQRRARVPVVNVANLSSIPFSKERLSSVLNWERDVPLRVLAQPVKLSHFFDSNKTYLLVGMTGELGQSLCRFMVSCGARHVLLGSRNPDTSARWISSLSSTGTDIRNIKLDVAEKSQVEAVASWLSRNMPPIAGVVNGALVLEDSFFVNTVPDMVEKQLRPKVQGTSNLDEVFGASNLDFFVALSSLASVYGNAGQSIYHAANLFMASLVEKKRTKLQCASIIDIGMIVDVGYVANNQRANGNIEQHLRSQFYTPLSESEFHGSFILAVLSGRPDSGNAAIITGIQSYTEDSTASSKPPWYDNPIFSHMITTQKSFRQTRHDSEIKTSPRMQLQEAGSGQEVMDVFTKLFCDKLGRIMRITTSSINTHAPLSDLGLDSLLAVEIRTWLLRDIGVNVPLLGIMGQESVSSIAGIVADTYGRVQEEHSSPFPNASDYLPSPATLAHRDLPNLHEMSSTSSRESISTNYTPLSTAMPPSQEIIQPITKICSLEKPQIQLESSTNDVQNHLTDFEPENGQSIIRAEKLSYPQASMHFLLDLLDDPTMFNVTAEYKIDGNLSVDKLERALAKTLAHHDAFRTCFFRKSGSSEFSQGILSESPSAALRVVDFTRDDVVTEIFTTYSNTRWNLQKGQSFGATLVRQSTDSHRIVFGCHHIVMDGKSWDTFLRDLDYAYRFISLPIEERSYFDFARHQRESLANGTLEESVQWWFNHLNPIPQRFPILPFALRKTRHPQNKCNNITVRRELEKSRVREIERTSRSCRVTTMQFYLTAMAVLLSRLSAIEELCIGVVDAGRGDFSNTIGQFSTPLPMRIRTPAEQRFEDALRNTANTVLDGLQHADVPVDEIIRRLGISRTGTEMPLFQISFNYRIGNLMHRKLGDCSLNLVKYRDAKTPYDITFNITQASFDVHLIEITSNSDLYSAEMTETILDSYIASIQNLIRDPTQEIGLVPMFNNQQVQTALTLGQGQVVEHEWPPTLTERFLQVCRDYPDAVAIKHQESSCTYKELQIRVHNLAAGLQNVGIGPDIRVAVLCDPSIELYTTMLAILHVGAAYIPLDLKLPVSRISRQIEHCEPGFILYHSSKIDIATVQLRHCLHIPVIDICGLQGTTQSPLVAFSTDFDILLFTSGTTGNPKGVKLTQKGIMNYAAAKKMKLGLGQIKVLQQSSIGFDMSLAQVFNAFANAGSLVIVPAESRGDPIKISELMLSESIDFTICTPTEYLSLTAYASETLRKCKSWLYACSGGESVTDRLISDLQRLELPELSLIDCYGPTELSCAITLRVHDLHAGNQPSDRRRSVGKAIPNTIIRIVDFKGDCLPVGFPGEIWAGGQGVSRGYLDPQDGPAKFVEEPFTSGSAGRPSEKLFYKTGDKGCLLDDGSLVLLGRVDGDTLVKLRGLRIDLSEVSTEILRAAQGRLTDAIVTVRGDPSFLVAHVVIGKDHTFSSAQLDHLRKSLTLPQYMLPTIILAMDYTPMTNNGKVDRKAIEVLPLPHLPTREIPDLPLTVVEVEVQSIWKAVLREAAGAAVIRPETDFFAVGGSSLLLLEVQNTFKERMGVHVTLADLYRGSTLRQMSALVDIGRSRLSHTTIDWKEEVTVPQTISSCREVLLATSPRESQREVLLTGADGFLGSRILHFLISNKDVERIHCIAVSQGLIEKIRTHPKVVTYPGSLLSSTLGLSETQLHHLRQSVDQIIHAGAQGHCLNNYSSVRDSNYLSTRFLVNLALARKAPFHYISSPRVILFSGSCSAPPVSMSQHTPPTDGSQGFTASKWASEAFLETVGHQTGLPVVIHRPCSLVGENAPHDDALNSVIRYSIITRSVPLLSDAAGFFDFKDVDSVANDIVSGSVKDDSISFRHYSSGVRVPFNDLAARMAMLYGGEFRSLEISQWISVAAQAGLESLIVSYLKENVVGQERLLFPFLGEN